MMKKVSVSVGLTVNLGNYQSAKITGGFDKDLPDDQDEGQAADSVYEFVENQVLDKLGKFLDKVESQGVLR